MIDFKRFHPVIQHVAKARRGITRAQLVKLTGLPRSTIYDAMRPFLIAGYIFRIPIHTGKRGRPRILFMMKDHLSVDFVDYATIMGRYL